jgi:hypothetical protein
MIDYKALAPLNEQLQQLLTELVEIFTGEDDVLTDIYGHPVTITSLGTSSGMSIQPSDWNNLYDAVESASGQVNIAVASAASAATQASAANITAQAASSVAGSGWTLAQANETAIGTLQGQVSGLNDAMTGVEASVDTVSGVAYTASGTAAQAEANALGASGYAGQAYGLAETAYGLAITADSNALLASGLASSGYNLANQAETDAQAAMTYAEGVYAEAVEAYNLAAAANSLGSTAQSQANAANSNASFAQAIANGCSNILGNNLTFRNRIINGRFDVNQMGTSWAMAVQTGYTSDQWIVHSTGTEASVAVKQFTMGESGIPSNPDNYLQVTTSSVAGTGNYCCVYQPIENVETLANGEVALQFYAWADTGRPIAVELWQNFGNGGSPTAPVSTPVGVFELTNAATLYETTAQVPSVSGLTRGTAGDYLALVFWLDAGAQFNARASDLGQQSGTFNFAEIQLEKGGINTTLEILPPGINLFRCQRYLEKSYDVSVTPGTNGAAGYSQYYLTGLTSATYNFGATTAFKVPKRATPTLTVYSYGGTAGDVLLNGGNVPATVSGVSTNNWTLNCGLAAASTQINATWHYVADSRL